MRNIIAAACVFGALAGFSGSANAQYYGAPPPRPPPGYYPPPAYERVPFGRRCRAFVRTRHGPERVICRIIRAKPLGEPCACPPPPGYGPGPYVGGRTVR